LQHGSQEFGKPSDRVLRSTSRQRASSPGDSRHDEDHHVLSAYLPDRTGV